MLSWFKRIAFWEGMSYLLLFFVAMPLKYFFGAPMMVRYVGALHGALFIAYVVLLVWNWYERKWTFRKVVMFGLASLVPFATFWVEKKVEEEEKQIVA
jgi:integral membrane protein